MTAPRSGAGSSPSSRKYHTELAVHRSWSLAQELCDEMAAVSPGGYNPMLTSDEWAALLRALLTGRGVHSPPLGRLGSYLGVCYERQVLPWVQGVLRAVLPVSWRKSQLNNTPVDVTFPPRRH